MITSGAPGVCYRCRLRRLRPPPQSFLTASSRALGGRPPILRSFSNSSTARSYGGPNPFDEDYNEKPRIVRYDGKKHVSRDRLLEERSARLNSNMLGKPAYAIVMRDRGIRNRRQPSPVPDDDVYAPEPTSIGDLLNNRGRRMTAEEVRDSINSLRPIGETAMSESAFRKLQESLANGFLTVHLQDYLAYHKRNTLPYQRLLVGEEIAETGEKKPAGKKIEA
ncbi:hypothetical protein GGS23DRAFT_549700, partial [Durotheca rogersii]|uniref:uncharacterized protein n=1 Tax=Durotheca rogersii TaxID=419775 RepID=UPI00221EA475